MANGVRILTSRISYKDLYFHLFGAMAQAVEHLEQGHILQAYDCLVKAQQETEEACLESNILPEQ